MLYRQEYPGKKLQVIDAYEDRPSSAQNALALIKAEEEKPKWQRKVIDFSRYLKKKLGE